MGRRATSRVVPLFGGGAVEWTSANGISVTGAFMQSYSTKTPNAIPTELERRHADVSVAIAAPVVGALSVYGSAGRSLTASNPAAPAWRRAEVCRPLPRLVFIPERQRSVERIVDAARVGDTLGVPAVDDE